MPQISDPLELPDTSAPAFYRERLAAVSDAMGAWPRCKRTACRRAGTCKNESEFIPLCFPTVMAAIHVCISECGSAIPGMPTPRPEAEPTLNQHMNQLMRRMAGIVEHQVATIERRIERREGQ